MISLAFLVATHTTKPPLTFAPMLGYIQVPRCQGEARGRGVGSWFKNHYFFTWEQVEKTYNFRSWTQLTPKIIRVAYQVDTNHFSGISIISYPPPSVGIVGMVFIGWYCSVFIILNEKKLESYHIETFLKETNRSLINHTKLYVRQVSFESWRDTTGESQQKAIPKPPHTAQH